MGNKVLRVLGHILELNKLRTWMGMIFTFELSTHAMDGSISFTIMRNT